MDSAARPGIPVVGLMSAEGEAPASKCRVRSALSRSKIPIPRRMSVCLAPGAQRICRQESAEECHRVHSDKVRDYQAVDASQYESQAAAIGWHGHEILFGLMYEFLKPGETLLDIGIGTGLSSLLFHKAGLQVSGFDSSAEMLQVCKSKGFSGKLTRHDLRNIPFPYETDSFDHVISLAVLNFFNDLAPVFREVARIVKSQGIFGFAIEEKRPGQKARYAVRFNRRAAQAKEQLEIAMYRHSDAQVRGLLESAGFSLLKDFEFLADKGPERGKGLYLTAYVARKGAYPKSAGA